MISLCAMIFIHIVFDLVSRLAAAETFDLCLGVGCCWFLLFLAWMGTAILAGGIAVVLCGDSHVGGVIECICVLWRLGYGQAARRFCQA